MFCEDQRALTGDLAAVVSLQGKRLPTHLSADAEEGEVSDDDSADEIEDDFKLRNSSVSAKSKHSIPIPHTQVTTAKRTLKMSGLVRRK